MKTIDQLNVSPIPWKAERLQTLPSWKIISNGSPIAHTTYDQRMAQNARLIAAAPDLYNELWKRVFGKIGVLNCSNCSGPSYDNCSKCDLGLARKVLEKVAGLEDE